VNPNIHIYFELKESVEEEMTEMEENTIIVVTTESSRDDAQGRVTFLLLSFFLLSWIG